MPDSKQRCFPDSLMMLKNTVKTKKQKKNGLFGFSSSDQSLADDLGSSVSSEDEVKPAMLKSKEGQQCSDDPKLFNERRLKSKPYHSFKDAQKQQTSKNFEELPITCKQPPAAKSIGTPNAWAPDSSKKSSKDSVFESYDTVNILNPFQAPPPPPNSPNSVRRDLVDPAQTVPGKTISKQDGSCHNATKSTDCPTKEIHRMLDFAASHPASSKKVTSDKMVTSGSSNPTRWSPVAVAKEDPPFNSSNPEGHQNQFFNAVSCTWQQPKTPKAQPYMPIPRTPQIPMPHTPHVSKPLADSKKTPNHSLARNFYSLRDEIAAVIRNECQICQGQHPSKPYVCRFTQGTESNYSPGEKKSTPKQNNFVCALRNFLPGMKTYDLGQQKQVDSNDSEKHNRSQKLNGSFMAAQSRPSEIPRDYHDDQPRRSYDYHLGELPREGRISDLTDLPAFVLKPEQYSLPEKNKYGSEQPAGNFISEYTSIPSCWTKPMKYQPEEKPKFGSPRTEKPAPASASMQTKMQISPQENNSVFEPIKRFFFADTDFAPAEKAVSDSNQSTLNNEENVFAHLDFKKDLEKQPNENRQPIKVVPNQNERNVPFFGTPVAALPWSSPSEWNSNERPFSVYKQRRPGSPQAGVVDVTDSQESK